MPSDISPTARALRAVEILQARPGVTAAELGQRLGVTERAARRYVGILREAGIPVESARGLHGGYRIRRGKRLPPVVFTEPEALSMVMAVLDGHPAATDPADLVGGALTKVIQALPEQVGQQAAALRDHAAAAPDRYPARPDPGVTSTLVTAVAERRRLRVTYRGDRGQWEEELDPWAVVVRYGRWYLLCHSHRVDAIRTYRIDRVGAVAQTGAESTAPDGLDPVAVLEQNLGAGWTFPTRVVFAAPQAEVAPWIRPVMGRLTPTESGCVLVGSTNNPTAYAQEWLARIPFDFQVAGGPELRDAMATLAARLAAALQPCPAT
ncbi:WYL domain-containing protein [Natronosporangium hydrolyticum]|uniref:WYL domain-containing protein n=1 Tax=Natronosporangium hydrolyticum TaxID=2811111 RepID=A0A895YC35_9ACTN|nr:WYL domain-containing protein [Natronosporangium hydrolyticum]QSB15384.1 WYL domain-containing protein [Natronosporangium hydrolyticum]